MVLFFNRTTQVTTPQGVADSSAISTTACPAAHILRSHAVSHSLAVIGILLAASLLRIIGLDRPSLWHDEVLTTISARAAWGDVIESVRHNENLPPLYFLFMKGWTSALGTSDFMLRLPSAIFGVVVVGVMYLLGRDLLGEREGLCAAALIALSPFHIAYSQEARPYSLLLLLSLVSCLCFVRMLGDQRDDRVKLAPQIGYCIASTLAMYTHPFAAFVIAGQNLHFIAWLLSRQNSAITIRRWITLQAIVVIGFGPWLADTMLVVRTGLPWIIRSTPFHEAMLSYAGNVLILTVLSIFCVMGLTRGILRRDLRVLLPVLLLILPVAGPLSMSSPRYGTFVARYGIAALAGLYLLSGYGLAGVGRWLRFAGLGAYCVLVLVSFKPGIATYFDAPAKADLRAAAAHVSARSLPGDGYLIINQYLFERVFDYYRRRDLTPVELGTASTKPDRLWLIAANSADTDRAARDLGYHLHERTQFSGVVVDEVRLD